MPPRVAPDPSTTRQALWLMFLVTTALGAVNSIQAWLYGPMIGRPARIWEVILFGAPNAYYWLVVTPLVLRLDRRFPLTLPKLRTGLPVHLAAATGLLVPYLVIVAWPPWAIGRSNQEPFGPWLLSIALGARPVVAYAMYFGAIAIHRSLEAVRTLDARRAEASRLEAELARAQLRALRMQLHPHFLFNTLQAIRTLIDEDPAAARRTVTLLGDLLRLTLTESDEQLVPLHREIEFLRPYLEIQQLRLGSRLSVTIDVDPEVADAAIPGFLLQPLVENAITHGISPRRAPGRVSIRAGGDAGHLLVSVHNDGPPLAQTARDGGIGLSTTRNRLAQLYGQSASLTLANDPGGGVLAELRIPRSPLA